LLRRGIAMMNNIARNALLNSWIKEIKCRKLTNEKLTIILANLIIENSELKNAVPTLEDFETWTNAARKSIPSSGGNGKNKLTEPKKNFIYRHWLRWNSQGKTKGRYKTSFAHEIHQIFEDPIFQKKYGLPFEINHICNLCREWEK
jgi:hypothetical protein